MKTKTPKQPSDDSLARLIEESGQLDSFELSDQGRKQLARRTAKLLNAYPHLTIPLERR